MTKIPNPKDEAEMAEAVAAQHLEKAQDHFRHTETVEKASREDWTRACEDRTDAKVRLDAAVFINRAVAAKRRGGEEFNWAELRDVRRSALAILRRYQMTGHPQEADQVIADAVRALEGHLPCAEMPQEGAEPADEGQTSK